MSTHPTPDDFDKPGSVSDASTSREDQATASDKHHQEMPSNESNTEETSAGTNDPEAQRKDAVRNLDRDDLVRTIGVMIVDGLEAQLKDLRGGAPQLQVPDSSLSPRSEETPAVDPAADLYSGIGPHPRPMLPSSLDIDAWALPATSTSAVEVAQETSLNNWIVGIKTVKHAQDRYGDYREIFDEASFLKQNPEGQKGGHIIKSVRYLDQKGKQLHESIRIVSSHIREVLQQVIKQGDREMLDSLSAEEVDFKEPYWPLLHHRRQLLDRLDGMDDVPKEHLRFLIDHLDSLDPEVPRLQELIEQGNIQKIEPKYCWMLYPPGSKVFRKEDGDWLAYEVIAPKGSSARLVLMSVKGYTLNTKAELVETFQLLPVPPLSETTAIEDLSFVPQALHPQSDDIEKSLIARGRRYFGFGDGFAFKEYNGPAWSRRDTEEPLRVVVDVKRDYTSKVELEPQKESRDPPTKALLHESSKSAEETILPDDQIIMLLPATIEAYSLRLKTVQTVRLDALKEITFDKDCWSKLVLSKDHKDMVISMVDAFCSKTRTVKDIVKGKGQGLVVLLHGPPGTGKTLTAECVAEQKQRPLFMITSGDLGTEAIVLETKLQDAFLKAKKWNAILLLDEADVFLQERDISQLKRNALVSVFLREIEYFDGILFLTTNRPGLLDEAFQSRVHLTLSLPDLTLKSQMKIWFLFLFPNRDPEKLSKSELALLRDINDLTAGQTQNGGQALNGRQIRNHVMTASALAAKNGRENITFEEIKKAITVQRKFEEYITELNASDNTTRATEMGLRLGTNRSSRAGNGRVSTAPASSSNRRARNQAENQARAPRNPPFRDDLDDEDEDNGLPTGI